MSVSKDARVFFGRGDGGTYGGRPVKLPPEDFSDLELDSMAPVSAAQQKRRARFTWLVTTIVVVLGLGSLVVFAQRALGGDGATQSAARPVADGPDAKSSRVAATTVGTVQELPVAAHSPPAVAPASAKSTEQKPLPNAAAPVVALEDLPVEAQPPPAVAPAPAKSTKQKRRANKQKRRANAKAPAKGNWDKLPPAP